MKSIRIIFIAIFCTVSIFELSGQNPMILDRVVAVVGDFTILQSDIEQEYQMVINDMKSKKSFEINVDQELIASTSDNLNTTPIQIKEDKLQFKLGNKSSNTTAPIRKSFSFR